jgi:hypothetical protein
MGSRISNLFLGCEGNRKVFLPLIGVCNKLLETNEAWMEYM